MIDKKQLYNTFEGQTLCASCGNCCKHCAANNGYFGPNDAGRTSSEIETLKTKYDFTPDKGFLGDKGCKLPAEERSIACLKYICYPLAELISPQKREEYESITGHSLLSFAGEQ